MYRQPKRWQYGVSANAVLWERMGQKVALSTALEQKFRIGQIPQYRRQAAMLSVYLYRNGNQFNVKS